MLLNFADNNLIWKQLSVVDQLGINNVISVGRRGDFVYEELQAEYNRISRNLTIRNRERNIDIVVDDDKVFGQNDPKKDTYGLRYTRHVKDNRHGYNCHCAATTCTLFPIAIHWEKQGESSYICIEQILRSLFRNCVSGYPDFRQVTLFSDRGYWTPSLVYFLLACGAIVHGTLIRALCWPMTYCQEKKGNDKRTFLDTKGPPSLFLKRLQNNSTRNQRLTVGAFRSGTDNISLAMSSTNHENEWDCILIDPRDYILYMSGELKSKAFSRVNIEKHDEGTECHINQIMANLLTQQVNPITITQGSVDWNYGRRLSFTSATSYDVCKVCLGSKCWHLFEAKSHFRALKAYLEGSIPIEQVEEGEQDEPEDSTAREDEDSDCEYDIEFIPETMQQQVKHDIYRLNLDLLSSNELRASPFYSKVDYLEAFIRHVTKNSDVSSRKTIPKTQNALKKLVDVWLNEENKERRKFFFLKVEGLQKAMAKKYGMNWKSERFPGKERPGEKDLLDHLGMENSGTMNNDDLTSKKLLLIAILKQSFYPSLKGEAKEAASIGHKMKYLFASNCFKRSQP